MNARPLCRCYSKVRFYCCCCDEGCGRGNGREGADLDDGLDLLDWDLEEGAAPAVDARVVDPVVDGPQVVLGEVGKRLDARLVRSI